MNQLINIQIYLSTIVGIAILAGIVVGVVIAILLRQWRELKDLINEKL